MRLAAIVLLAVAAIAAPAHARTPLVVGIGDQQASSFVDARFGSLGLRHTRAVVPWHAVHTNRAWLDAWLGAARAHGLRPLVAFDHSTDDVCTPPCRAPSARAYTRAFNVFRRRYPWVRTFSPWNEANHGGQPTARRPDLAARYYEIVRSRCRRCTIVAADVLDSGNMDRWTRGFLRAVRHRPRLFGLHNYGDVNRFRATRTRRFMRLVPGRVWLTETGGVVTALGARVWAEDEARARRATSYTLRMARARPRITRVYLYQWRKTNPFDDFDAGLVRADGSLRPAFGVVRNWVARYGAG